MKTLKRLIGKLFCKHSRTFEFYPDDCYWSRDGKSCGKFTHGAKVIGCMDCGLAWVENYAE